VTHGARIQGGWNDHGYETVGIVSDLVTAVRVGDVEAVLANNVFVADTFSFDEIVVTTADGEQAVRRPNEPRLGF
jgi:imidazole glycerol phosphate synthase subunit HisF